MEKWITLSKLQTLLDGDDVGKLTTLLEHDTYREVQNNVPTCLLPSQHAGKDTRTLPQVGICFSQLWGQNRWKMGFSFNTDPETKLHSKKHKHWLTTLFN